MDEVAGFREADYPLRGVAVAEWDGHVFINLLEDPPPLSGQLAELPAKFRPWRMEELRMVERRVYSLKANWKLVFQNYSECLHCPIVHPLLHQQSHYLSGDNEPPRPTYLGGRMDLREGVQTLSMDGTTNRSCLTGLAPEDRRRVYYYAILPNLLLNLHPDYTDLHALAAGRRPHRHRLRVALPPGRDREPGFRPWRGHRVLGPHEPPGLGAVRARAGGNLLAGLPARAVLQPRGAAHARRVRAERTQES
jgi:hypothetical protein